MYMTQHMNRKLLQNFLMSKSKEKIFIVAPCLSMGGMERAAVNTANGLKALGYDIVFLSIIKKDHFFKLAEGIQLIDPVGFNMKTMSLTKSVSWIRAVVYQHKPNQVLVFNKFYGAITALALIGTGFKFSISERSSPLYKWDKKVSLLSRIAYWINPPKAVIAQTTIAREFQVKYYKNSKVKVIPNSVREVKLYPSITRENFILAVGRLDDYLKGFDLLIEAFSLLASKDWYLYFAGGEDKDSPLAELAERLNVNSRIKFLGKIADLDEYYAKCGIYIIPSRSEGFPNALAEAMAAGCCCVAFDFVAGPRDLITDSHNGFIVEQNNPKALAEKLDRLILDQSLRQSVGNNALEVRERLRVEKITQEIADFILN